jgi:hypothetical protein
MRRRYALRVGRVLGPLGLGIAAACSFSEGADWPPLRDPAALRDSSAAAGMPGPGTAGRPSLAAFLAGTPGPPPAAAAARVGRVQPLAVIRFGAGPVGYEDALYEALRGALERRPAAAFDLVAVMAEADSTAQRAAAERLEQVFLSVTGMGLPAERVSLSATTLSGLQVAEVHVYVR